MKKLRNLLLTLSFLLLITAASCVTAFAASTDPVTIPDNHLRNALLTKLSYYRRRNGIFWDIRNSKQFYSFS